MLNLPREKRRKWVLVFGARRRRDAGRGYSSVKRPTVATDARRVHVGRHATSGSSPTRCARAARRGHRPHRDCACATTIARRSGRSRAGISLVLDGGRSAPDRRGPLAARGRRWMRASSPGAPTRRGLVALARHDSRPGSRRRLGDFHGERLRRQRPRRRVKLAIRSTTARSRRPRILGRAARCAGRRRPSATAQSYGIRKLPYLPALSAGGLNATVAGLGVLVAWPRSRPTSCGTRTRHRC